MRRKLKRVKIHREGTGILYATLLCLLALNILVWWLSFDLLGVPCGQTDENDHTGKGYDPSEGAVGPEPVYYMQPCYAFWPSTFWYGGCHVRPE